MTNNNAFQFYHTEHTAYFIDVSCQFQKLTPEVITETKGLFSMLALALQYNIRLNLDNLFFIDSTYTHLLMEFARDLRASNRSLILKGVPISIVRYMERFGMVKLCLLQDVTG